MARFRLAVLNTQPPHLYFGGVERRILETAKRLQTEANITIYSGTKAGFKTATALDGVRLVSYHSTDRVFPLDNWTFNRSLTKKARALDADVFDGHAVSGYGLPQKLRQLGINKPFIHTIHGVLADEYQQAKKGSGQTLREKAANCFMKYLAGLEAKTAQNATLIVTISNYSLQKIREHYGVVEGKVRIVPNGVDIMRFKPATDVAAAKRQFGLGTEPCVLFVGSLIPRKGLPLLVEAAKRVVKTRAETKFVIAGKGPLESQLTDTLKKSNITRNFVFLGNVKEDGLIPLYNCADVFVLPSIQEGQGIVLLEAQACGKPVVAFGVGGVNEAVRNGETGLLVETGNTDALAEGLLKLLDDEPMRLRMGAEGRRFVSDNFTWDLCAHKMLNVYREALATNRFR
jgi:glycosyltransferase involved in cell wall biosynthesis